LCKKVKAGISFMDRTLIWFDFWCFSATFNNISAISWRTVLVVDEGVAQWVRSLDLTTHAAWVRARLCKLQKGCTRLAAASDKVYQLLAHGRWFSPGTPASSTTKTVRHDIAEILLKVALKHQKSTSEYTWNNADIQSKYNMNQF
jgi:hypothetical protein